MGSSDQRVRTPIQGVGEVLEILENGVHHLRMPNGYEVGGYLDPLLKMDPAGPEIAAGVRVLVEFSAYDMTQAKILGLA